MHSLSKTVGVIKKNIIFKIIITIACFFLNGVHLDYRQVNYL